MHTDCISSRWTSPFILHFLILASKPLHVHEKLRHAFVEEFAAVLQNNVGVAYQERMSRRRSIELRIGGPKRAFNISQRQIRQLISFSGAPTLPFLSLSQALGWPSGDAGKILY